MTDSHIKMPDISPIIRYVGDGTTTAFIFPFPIFEVTDLQVFFNAALQTQGYSVTGTGQSAGGRVTFATPPTANVVITLKRVMKVQRLTDFTEGGLFSANAINTELDALTAISQQLAADQGAMLRYHPNENPAMTNLPSVDQRKNMALGFDGQGNPVALPIGSVSPQTNFTATGSGAITRNVSDKLSDVVSVRDFGAIGNGIANDTLAIQQALAAHKNVYVPSGTYLISAPLTLTESKSLIGAGQGAIIKCTNNLFNAINVTASYCMVRDLRIENGKIGVSLFGATSPCVQNNISNLTIWGSDIGVQLDGYQNTNNPCYWNNFDHILVAQPKIHGIFLTKSGAGDTPNANKFHLCRVYSLGATTSGHGIYVQHGSFNNAFVDCESNVNGATAQSCFTMGAGSNKTLLINPYAESNNQVPNIKLELGSLDTSIYNLLSASDGAAIWDLSGGQYTAYNAGFPYKNKFDKTKISDVTAQLQRYDTEYLDASGTRTLDLSHSVHLISSFGGALTVNLPSAASAAGAWMVVKKIDSSKNVITVGEVSGNGPDGSLYFLGSENDYVCMMSNGAEWFVIASNRSVGNTRFYDGSGLYPIDMAVDVYLLSSFGGALNAQLPPANATKSIGRRITIKKTDTSTNPITLTEQGGSGADQATQTLADRYDAITVVSDGSQWFIVSRFG